MPPSPSSPAGRFADVIGRQHLASWTPAQLRAWTGLIETFEAQQRTYAADLEAALGLSPSAAGLLGRLDGAPDGCLRLSALASAAELSLSRVSRIADALERRGLVEKRPCAGDGRATNAHITPGGRDVAAAAQAFLNGWLGREFFAHLTTDETEALAAVFTRLAGDRKATPTGDAPRVVVA